VGNQQVRVAGDVVAGSVEKIDAGLALRFTVHDGSGQMPVYYKGGPVPDIFGEQVQVVVEGKVGPDGTFQASTLLAKCPSKFETEASAGAGDMVEFGQMAIVAAMVVAAYAIVAGPLGIRLLIPELAFSAYNGVFAVA